MSTVHCTMPGCSTSAGCQCGKMGRYSFTPYEVRHGWLCPLCKCAHAPDVKTCPSEGCVGLIETDGPISSVQWERLKRRVNVKHQSSVNASKNKSLLNQT